MLADVTGFVVLGGKPENFPSVLVLLLRPLRLRIPFNLFCVSIDLLLPFSLSFSARSNRWLCGPCGEMPRTLLSLSLFLSADVRLHAD